jgi:ribA/ribD-fused uncharacterized protein
LTDEVPVDELRGAFVVLSGKAGWKGAAHLSLRCAEQSVKPASDADNCDGTTMVNSEEEKVMQHGSPDAESLLDAARCARAGGVVLCWKETQDNGYLSNWAKSGISIEGVTYNCVEQWIMACKARACGDASILQQIMQAQSPRKQKGLGRSLDKKLVQRFWRQSEKWNAQLRGVRAKFSQNATLAVRLLRTGVKQIAEASPSDVIFGIGLAPSDPLAQDPKNWKGMNLLGNALMQVREEIRQLVMSGRPLSELVEHVELQAQDALDARTVGLLEMTFESRSDSGSGLEDDGSSEDG